jgi:predicted  nucleic acid-binding Zn ribbon protein
MILIMHSLSIQFKKDTDETELWQKFYHVVGSLRENGQINGREMNAYIKDNIISINLWTFTEEAMDEKYFTKYVTDSIAVLEEFCGYKTEIKYLGYLEEEQESICSCNQQDYFVLYYYGDFSPVRCGSCQKFVPLFKIPKLHDTRIWDILGWVNAYKACKILDLNGGTGERWAIQQQNNCDSGLSKQGRKVAAKITEVSGVPTYYFLTNFKKISKSKDRDRPCPGCGGEWHLDKEIFGYFRHKCDKCLLMSGYSSYNY